MVRRSIRLRLTSLALVSLAACSSRDVSIDSGRGGSAGAGATIAGGASGSGSGGLGSSGTSSQSGAGGKADTDCALAAQGIAIYGSWDELGYPPYALDGCRLAYIAPDGSLRLQDLVSHDEQVLDAPEAVPGRPTLSPSTVAWQARVNGESVVRVLNSGIIITVTGEFQHAEEPKVFADSVVFSAFSSADPHSDCDVLLYDVATGTLGVAIGGAGQQRFADISADFVAASDFSEDPNGYFDLGGSVADIVIYSRANGTFTRRARPGKQAFPLLGNDGTLAYLEWGSVHPEPKFSAFALMTGSVSTPPEGDALIRNIQTDPSYLRPALRGNLLDFVDSSLGSPTLYRASLNPRSEPTAAIEGTGVQSLLGPASTDAWTLLGQRLASGPVLRVLAR